MFARSRSNLAMSIHFLYCSLCVCYAFMYVSSSCVWHICRHTYNVEVIGWHQMSFCISFYFYQMTSLAKPRACQFWLVRPLSRGPTVCLLSATEGSHHRCLAFTWALWFLIPVLMTTQLRLQSPFPGPHFPCRLQHWFTFLLISSMRQDFL